MGHADRRHRAQIRRHRRKPRVPADENDQGVIGEVFSEPNAETFARGRLFFERGYVVKWSAMYQLPYGLRGGTAARYQDGQHFSPRRDARDLKQGVDFVPALPRGLTRYTYAFTLDTRLEKQCRRRPPGAVILDVFNLLNTNNEVEEDEVTGPAFRAPRPSSRRDRCVSASGSRSECRSPVCRHDNFLPPAVDPRSGRSTKPWRFRVKYMLLIYDNEQVWTDMPPDEQGRLFGEYMEFTEGIRSRGTTSQAHRCSRSRRRPACESGTTSSW